MAQVDIVILYFIILFKNSQVYYYIDVCIENNCFKIFSLPPPASKEVVNNLPEITIDTEGKNCPICLKEFKINEKAKNLPCEHFFHPTCILTWLNKVKMVFLCLKFSVCFKAR